MRLTALLLIPALLFLGLYWRSLDYDFVWTDQGEIEMGLLILPPGEIHTAFWRPMLTGLEELTPGLSSPYYRPLQVIVASWIDHHQGKLPRNFRVLNLVLGAFTSIGVTWLAWRLFGRADAALLAGGIFAAHPANIENTVWIAGLSHALAALFITASLLLAVAALQTKRRAVRIATGAGSLVALSMGLLSKENAAVTPLLLFAVSISLVVKNARASEGGSGDSGSTATIKICAGVLCALQLLITAAFALVWRPHVLGGALAEAAPLLGSWPVQILTSVAAWSDAMSWLLLPLQSNTSDVVNLVGSPLHPRFLLGLVLAGISLAVWLRLLRGRMEVAALGLAWIWIAFAPTSGLVPLNHMRGERYLALSLLGLALLIPALLIQLRARLAGRRGEVAFALLAIVIVVGLAQRSWQRTPDWRSDLTLFSSDVRRAPLYREGYHELAKAYVEAEDLRSAQQTLVELGGLGDSLSGTTGFFRPYDMIDLHCQINLALGEPEQSVFYFEKLEPDSPDVRALPKLSLCAARTLRDVGEEERALGILESLYGLGPSPWRTDVVLTAAEIHADERRYRDADRWLARLDRSQIQDSDQLHRWTELRSRVSRHAPAS